MRLLRCMSWGTVVALAIAVTCLSACVAPVAFIRTTRSQSGERVCARHGVPLKTALVYTRRDLGPAPATPAAVERFPNAVDHGYYAFERRGEFTVPAKIAYCAMCEKQMKTGAATAAPAETARATAARTRTTPATAAPTETARATTTPVAIARPKAAAAESVGAKAARARNAPATAAPVESARATPAPAYSAPHGIQLTATHALPDGFGDFRQGNVLVLCR